MIYQTLMGTLLHFCVKIRPRRVQDASRRPWTPQFGAQEGSGATQKAPKMRQEPPKSCPRGVQEAHWGEDTPQSSPRLPPDFDFGSFWQRFGRILSAFWMDFWKDFNTNWIHILATIRLRCWGGCPLLKRKLGGANAACRFGRILKPFCMDFWKDFNTNCMIQDRLEEAS